MGEAIETYFVHAEDPPVEASNGAVEGLAVSAGICEGTARLITSIEDLTRIERGDVLVAAREHHVAALDVGPHLRAASRLEQWHKLLHRQLVMAADIDTPQ